MCCDHEAGVDGRSSIEIMRVANAAPPPTRHTGSGLDWEQEVQDMSLHVIRSNIFDVGARLLDHGPNYDLSSFEKHISVLIS